MSSEISRLTLEIDSNGVVKANGNLDLFKKKADEAAKSGTTLGSTFSSMRDVMQGPIAAFQMVSGALSSVKAKTNELETAWGIAESASAILRSTIEATGASAWTSAAEIEAMASRLQDITLYGDETTIAMQNVLLGFKNIKGDNFEDATKAILDMATVMHMDLTSAAQAVGKALDDPIKGVDSLSRQGFRFTDQQKYMLEAMVNSDNIMGAQNYILKELATTFGGASEAAAETAVGLKIQLANALDDSEEQIGRYIANALIPLRESWLDVARSQTEYYKNAADYQDVENGSYKKDDTDTQIMKLEGARERLDAIALLNSIGGKSNEYLAAKYEEYDEQLKRLKIRRQFEQIFAQEKAAEDAKAKADADALEESRLREIETAEKWQKVLKATLGLESVTTGAQAVADYQKDLEKSLQGAIAYAKMTGESVKDVYVEYGNKIRGALLEILSSGQFNVFDDAVTLLSSLEKTYSVDLRISSASMFDNDLFSASGKPSDSIKQSYIEMIAAAQAEAAKIGDWSAYAKNSAISAGYQSIQGTDVGNFAQGMSQGGWQQGIINMVIGAFVKNLEDIESFQRALNLVTEAIKPAAEMIGDVTDALEPLMDAAVIGGEIGQDLAEVTLMIKPMLPVLRMSAASIYYISKLLQMGMSGIESAFDWLFGDITDGMNDFADAMYDSTKSAEEQADATSSLIDELKALREQLREDQLYYSSQNMSLNAAQNISSVNDAIIAPGGRIISTHPDDFLIATKTPGSFGSKAPDVYFTIVNEAGDMVHATGSQSVNPDGSTEIIATVKKIIANDIASGGMDTALSARERRLAGRRISV